MNPAGLALLPNLGGEAGEAWRRLASEPAVAAAASLWGSLFGQSARIDERPASPHREPAFDWLPDQQDGALAWWCDPRAAADPALAGRRWLGATPETVLEVHDKAFALRHGPTPAPLRGIARSFEPAELADPDAAIAQISHALAAWPAELRDHFCLKPRLGSSGRGRVIGGADLEALRGALPRLARCGGAILEPWLERSLDLSVSFHVRDAANGPPLELLGVLISLCTSAGVPRGHRGEVDRRGRVHSGTRFDDALREAGGELALAAFEAGYRGPCGIDGFAYRPGTPNTTGTGRPERDVLRPAVELNARFTMGIVALGCLRRARRELRDRLAIEPDTRAGAIVAYAAPDCDWSELDVDLVLPIEVCPPADPERGPAILASRDPARLDPIAESLARAPAVGGAEPL